MGKKLYVKDETGIKFTSQRKPGDVRIPNYVYDMWLPLLGAETLGVYAVYCRLEMEGTVKKMTMDTLAGACRIGKVKLSKINAKLEQCGFIKVIKPTGQARLMHWTSEVVIFDPPQTVPQKLIDNLAPERGYEVLTPWLVKEDSELTEVLDGTSGGAGQNRDEVPDDTPNIESLGLNPLVIEEGGEVSPPPPDFLSHVLEHAQKGNDKAGVADPSQDNAQWLRYRDEVIQVFIDGGGIIKGNDKARESVRGELQALAGEFDFDIERWRRSVKSVILAGSVNPANVSCFIDTYRFGGDYHAMQEAKRKGGRNATHQRPDKSAQSGVSGNRITPAQRAALARLDAA